MREERLECKKWEQNWWKSDNLIYCVQIFYSYEDKLKNNIDVQFVNFTTSRAKANKVIIVSGKPIIDKNENERLGYFLQSAKNGFESEKIDDVMGDEIPEPECTVECTITITRRVPKISPGLIPEVLTNKTVTALNYLNSLKFLWSTSVVSQLEYNLKQQVFRRHLYLNHLCKGICTEIYFTHAHIRQLNLITFLSFIGQKKWTLFR